VADLAGLLARVSADAIVVDQDQWLLGSGTPSARWPETDVVGERRSRPGSASWQHLRADHRAEYVVVNSTGRTDGALDHPIPFPSGR